MESIGVDLGGTKTEWILCDSENPLQIKERIRLPTQQEKGYDFILKQLVEQILYLKSQCDSHPSIGLGIPGSISPKTQLVRCANTQCLIGKPLKHDLEKRLEQPVTIENDANCFALSEALLGRGQGQALVLGIIMGTGMGGGVVYQGKLWKGRHGNAGEWGHASLDPNGPKCWCGKRGCAELYLSGSGIQRMYQEASGEFKEVTSIYADFLAQKPIATKTLQEVLQYFGQAMANLITSIDPDVIVIGGGVSQLPLLYTEGVASVREHLFGNAFDTPIVPNALGDSSGIYGASLLAKASH